MGRPVFARFTFDDAGAGVIDGEDVSDVAAAVADILEWADSEGYRAEPVGSAEDPEYQVWDGTERVAVAIVVA